MREYRDLWNGFTIVGNPQTRRLGELDRRMVLRSSARRFFQYISSIHLAVLVMSTVHVVSGKYASTMIHDNQFEIFVIYCTYACYFVVATSLAFVLVYCSLFLGENIISVLRRWLGEGDRVYGYYC